MIEIKKNSKKDPANFCILFLGFAVPQCLMNEIINSEKIQPQIAAHKLQWHIISGIEESIGCGIDLLSSMPVSDFPHYPKVLFWTSSWKHRDDTTDSYIPFINYIIIKHITRFISAFVKISSWLFKHSKCESRLIIIYAMHSPHVVASFIARRLWGAKIVVIVPDLPEYMDGSARRGILRRIMKPIDGFILRKFVAKADGLIVLTRHIAEDLVEGKLPYVVVEGAVSMNSSEIHGKGGEFLRRSNKGERIISYAGGLSAEYGVKLLLEAFSLLSGDTYRLWLCGRGAMEDAVKAAAVLDHRIIYWGALNNRDVLDLELQSTILVNPRPSSGDFTKYSFPSKLLEYMATGRPVVTTPLKGIPDEYRRYLYVLDDESPSGLANLLQSLCSNPDEELSGFGARAKEFVIDHKNYRQQGERIVEFIKGIM